MLKRYFQCAICFVLCSLLCSCSADTEREHRHKWQAATCVQPRICTTCNAVDGEALGHQWIDATCVQPKMCVVCDTTDGEALGHQWIDATCLSPRTCNMCNTTDGGCSDHSWKPATCTAKEICVYCDKENIYSELLAHNWLPASLEAPATCAVCRITDGEPLALSVFDRGRYGQWGTRPSAEQYIGLTGYVAVTHLSFLYSVHSNSPHDNEWLNSPWYATTYEKDKQFYTPVGIVEHKTPVIVLDADLESNNQGTYNFDGFLLVKKADGQSDPFYISVTDFVTMPYWETDDIASLDFCDPVLAVYHQQSDYWPVDRRGKKVDLADGSIVIIWDNTGSSIDVLSESGRCFINPSDLTIIY